jgi:fumarate reductase iron-sulfur subunit
VGHAALSMAGPREFEALIWRGGEDGRFVAYRVPAWPKQTVLDVVTYVQRRLDPTLAYRFACRVGMCGSCAMQVDATPRWTCRTQASGVAQDGRIRIAPLRHFPIIRDLVVDMRPFFERWQQARGRFVPSAADSSEFARIEPKSPEREAADAGIECIGCGVCHAACDVVGWNPDYLGPAALNRAWTLVNDARDGERAGHLAAVATDAGCHLCHSHESCTRSCPKHLSPTASIAGLKRAALRATIKGEL